MERTILIVCVCAGLLLAACVAARQAISTPLPAPKITPLPTPADRMARAELNYNQYCAHCHGYDGEGQVAETVEQTQKLGYHIVPPHDSTGHTWQHTDDLLVQVIRDGIQNPLNLYPMTGFGYVFSEDDIRDIIAYIKRWWTDEQRAHQAAITTYASEVRANVGLTDPTVTP